MVERSQRHKKRVGRSGGFVIHFRGAGVDQQKMDAVISDYYSKKADLLYHKTSSAEFEANMSIDTIARGDYKPDRTWSLKGASAYVREKIKYMKDLGFVRKDGFDSQVLHHYVRILRAGNREARLSFLQRRISRWKLPCPQGARPKWTPRQNGYRHYRIRPGVMFLYAVKSAQENGVEINTDDLMLTALRFFTPKESSRVDEQFLKNHIDRYFGNKRTKPVDYRGEFESQMDRVERDSGELLRKSDPFAFSRKCRNAANDVYCPIILMREVGLIEAENRNQAIAHWSATQQAYERTPKVPEFNVVRMTEAGTLLLDESMGCIPIWYEDICEQIGTDNSMEVAKIVSPINKLGSGLEVLQEELSLEHVHSLAALGLTGAFQNNVFVPDKRPVFELQYDMP